VSVQQRTRVLVLQHTRTQLLLFGTACGRTESFSAAVQLLQFALLLQLYNSIANKDQASSVQLLALRAQRFARQPLAHKSRWKK
jgi:hypothetical protein